MDGFQEVRFEEVPTQCDDLSATIVLASHLYLARILSNTDPPYGPEMEVGGLQTEWAPVCSSSFAICFGMPREPTTPS